MRGTKDRRTKSMEAKKDEFKDDLVIGPCINSGWPKLANITP